MLLDKDLSISGYAHLHEYLQYLIEMGRPKESTLLIILIYHVVYLIYTFKSDTEVESCWDKFSTLKGRIMFHIDSENEGWVVYHGQR